MKEWIPRDLDGASEALDKAVLVRVNKVEKFARGCHDKNELDQVLLIIRADESMVEDKISDEQKRLSRRGQSMIRESVA